MALKSDEEVYGGLNKSRELRRDRALWGVLGALGVAALIFVAFFIGTTYDAAVSNDDESNLYKVNNPIKVLDRVEGFSGPSAYTDQETLDTLTFSCLRAHEEDLSLNFSTTWQKIGTDGATIETFVAGSTGSLIFLATEEDSAGCFPGHEGDDFLTTVPESVDQGVWKFTSNVTLTNVEGDVIDTEITVSERIHFVDRE